MVRSVCVQFLKNHKEFKLKCLLKWDQVKTKIIEFNNV